MKAYSLDLRERIVHAVVERECSPQEVAERFAVGLTTVKRYVQLAAVNALAPKPRPGRSRTRHIRPEHDAALWAQLEAHGDAILTEQCRLWHETQGVVVSEATMGRAIRRLGWTRKKRHWQPASGANPLDRTGAPSSPTTTRTTSSSSTNRVPTSP
jgi:transposase